MIKNRLNYFLVFLIKNTQIGDREVSILVFKTEMKQRFASRWAAIFDPSYNSSSVKLGPRALSRWQLIGNTKIVARRLTEFFLEEISAFLFGFLPSLFSLFFFLLLLCFFFCGTMSNERTLPRRRAAACPSWVIRREGAKKWSDQCQISAFTASVCDPQRHVFRACADREREARSRRLVNYLRTHTGTHTRACNTHAKERRGKGYGRNEPLCATECSLSASMCYIAS